MAVVKSYKAPSRTLRLRTNLQNAMHEAKVFSGMSEDELCRALNMCRTTLWAYLKEPDKFNLFHLRVIARLSGKDFSVFLSDLVK